MEASDGKFAPIGDDGKDTVPDVAGICDITIWSNVEVKLYCICVEIVEGSAKIPEGTDDLVVVCKVSEIALNSDVKKSADVGETECAKVETSKGH